MTLPSLLDARAVARLLNVSRSYVYRLFKRGDIPVFHLGVLLRTRRRDVIDYMRRHPDRFPVIPPEPAPTDDLDDLFSEL